MKALFSKKLTLEALALGCGGRLIPSTDAGAALQGLCTDSREADATVGFVALRGERVDGHDYIAQAIQNGCRCILCEQLPKTLHVGVNVILVEDSELALSGLAQWYQRQLMCQKIAITGSVGKTTTKEMVAAVLSACKQVYRSKGNHNSVIGMPLSVMEIPSSCEYAVLEMGMSGFGEIERMSLAAEPEIGIITNIGSSHMELLGSRENICRAKLELLCGLRKGGVLLLNGDETLLSDIGGAAYQTMYISTHRKDVDLFSEQVQVLQDRTVFDAIWHGERISNLCVRIPGRHNVYAALYAVAVGILAGLSVEDIRRGLLQYETGKLRQHWYDFRGMTIFEDCYNAAPESMCAAIETLAERSRMCRGRSVAVLGDMLELGENSVRMHQSVGTAVVTQGIDLLYTIGDGGREIALGALSAGMCSEQVISFTGVHAVMELRRQLRLTLQPNDIVLFKASRSVQLEHVIAGMQEDWSAR